MSAAIDQPPEFFAECNSSRWAEAWSARARDPEGRTNVSTPPPPPLRWRRLVKPAATAVVAVSAFSLVLAWGGGALRKKIRPGELPPARPSATGRTVVPVERVRGEETVTAVGSVHPKGRTEVASQLLATVLEVRVRPGDRVKLGDA